jgi:hypothetical protein
VCADNQPQKNYFHQHQKINVKIFAVMVEGVVPLWHEKQGNKALLKKLKIMAHGITYAELQTAKKRHELAAQTLRYAGYKAQCCKNEACAQPYQVNVKGIDSNTAKELQVLVCGLLKDETLNVTEA